MFLLVFDFSAKARDNDRGRDGGNGTMGWVNGSNSINDGMCVDFFIHVNTLLFE